MCVNALSSRSASSTSGTSPRSSTPPTSCSASARVSRPIYEPLVRTAVHLVKAAHIATFLGRRLLRSNAEEIGNDFDTRIQGTRIKHRMGPTAIKAYDKAGILLRIETTTNNPGWFTHYRTVVHRNGTRSHELAPL